MRQFGSAISQCQGTVVKSYDYNEFGVTTSTGDTFFNEVTFTGSVADASGLLYMNARYYNPSTARFLSQDTYPAVYTNFEINMPVGSPKGLYRYYWDGTTVRYEKEG